MRKRYCTALFICSGLLLAHAMRTTLAVTAVIILSSKNEKVVLNKIDNVKNLRLYLLKFSIYSFYY